MDIWLQVCGAVSFILATFGLNFLRDISKSVAELNKNIAVVIERTDSHSMLLSEHGARIRNLEVKKTKPSAS